MLPSEMILSVRQHVGDTSVDVTASKQRYTDTQYLRFLNEAMQEIADRLIIAEPTRLEVSATLSYVSGTELYNLPSRCHQVRNVVRTDGTVKYPLSPLERPQDRTDYQSTLANVLSGTEEKYYFLGNQIGIVPVPSVSLSGNITVTFIRFPSPMMIGTIFSAAGVTITFPETPTAGSLSYESGEYVGAKIQLTSGPGIGGNTTGVSYVPSTHVLTTTGLGGLSWENRGYELLCGLDLAFHNPIVLLAAAYAYRGEESLNMFNSFYAAAEGKLQEALGTARRQTQELGRMRHIRR